MNYKNQTLMAAGIVLISGSPWACAQEDAWPAKNRIGISYRMGFNIATRFRNLGGGPVWANNPSVTGLSYQDGFVGTDDTGNAAGLTTFWGYQDARQVADNEAVLLMHSTERGALGRKENDSPHHGLELTYNHEFARKESWRWGAELAFNWTDFSTDKKGVVPAGVMAVDAFPLGYGPPAAPYTGPFNAGPFIPTLDTDAVRLPVNAASHLEAKFYGVRVGPYLDLPIGERALLTLSAGLAVTIVDGEYSFAESYITPGGATIRNAARRSDTSAVVGGYAGARATVKLAKHLDLFTGFQYQCSDNYKLRAANKEAEINLRSALFVSAGLGYTF